MAALENDSTPEVEEPLFVRNGRAIMKYQEELRRQAEAEAAAREARRLEMEAMQRAMQEEDGQRAEAENTEEARAAREAKRIERKLR